MSVSFSYLWSFKWLLSPSNFCCSYVAQARSIPLVSGWMRRHMQVSTTCRHGVTFNPGSSESTQVFFSNKRHINRDKSDDSLLFIAYQEYYWEGLSLICRRNDGMSTCQALRNCTENYSSSFPVGSQPTCWKGLKNERLPYLDPFVICFSQKGSARLWHSSLTRLRVVERVWPANFQWWQLGQGMNRDFTLVAGKCFLLNSTVSRIHQLASKTRTFGPVALISLISLRLLPASHLKISRSAIRVRP